MVEFHPFADDTTALTIGGMTVENSSTRVSLSGCLDITRDRQGLEQIVALKAVIDAAHAKLVGDTNLGEQSTLKDVPTRAKSTRRNNPFV